MVTKDARLLAAAPAAWWRPPLGVVRLLDMVSAEVDSPLGIVAGSPGLTAPALIRWPRASLLMPGNRLVHWGSLLPAIEAFTGVAVSLQALESVPPRSLRTLLWLEPDWPGALARLRQCLALLEPGGGIAIASRGPASLHLGRWWALLLRPALRRYNCRVIATAGFLGPRALAWSARGRLATALGRPDRYDDCHVAMRQSFMELWPWSAACVWSLTVARRLPDRPKTGGPGSSAER